ncbi:unnamed protein product [Linum trigynum]|uniref:Uncharacterized protein n=1 Tax=Linum trigynum TaxID=586398 RepID=A0AAV2EJM6_9ROSI
MLTTQASESCNASVRHFLKPNHQLDHFSHTLIACWQIRDTRREQVILKPVIKFSPSPRHTAGFKASC